MSRTHRTLLALALVATLAGRPLHAATGLCESPGSGEHLRYSWKLRGALAWVAGLKFPTSGTGDLRTSARDEGSIDSKLLIQGDGAGDDFYVYQSQMDRAGDRTLVSYHGYSFNNRERKEQTLFDYVKKLVRIHKETPDEVQNKVKKLPGDSMRDVLTGIYFLRQNAPAITAPMASQIYSDGSIYPVMFRPAGAETIVYRGQRVATRAFLITAAPGSEKRWPGGVKVWLTDDDQRMPVRIEIQRSFAALQLNLQSIESCGFNLQTN